METLERIEVYTKIKDGKTVCLCLAGAKKCGSKSCEKVTLKRDKYEGWHSVFVRDRYGH